MTTARPAAISSATSVILLLWINRGLEVLWLLTVFLVPLAFFGPDYVLSEAIIAYVEVPKIALLRTLVGLMAILWLVEWGIQGRLPLGALDNVRALQLRPSAWRSRLVGWLRDQPARWVILAVWFSLATTLVSTALSGSFGVSMRGEVPGQDGFTGYTTIAYVLLFGVIATHLKTRPQLLRLLATIVVMGVLIAGYGVLQHYDHDFLGILEATGGSRDRVTSFMANADFSGAAMFMPIVISLVLATISLKEPVATGLEFRRRLALWSLSLAVLSFWVLVLEAQLLGIAFTFTRGAWVGTLLALGGFLGLGFAFAGWRVLGRAGLVLGMAGGLALVALRWPGVISPFTHGAGLVLILGLLGLLGGFAIFAGRDSFGREALGFGKALPWSGLALGTAAVLGAGLILAVPLVRGESGLLTFAGDSHATRVVERFGSVGSEVVTGDISGRSEIWSGSWRLIQDRPWFEFDTVSFPWLRPLIGYGPDLFRYTFLLESLPASSGSFPMEPDHAHNYYIHQTVEQGLLGLLGSLGIFVAVFGVAGHQLLWRRREYSGLHKVVLIGLLAVLVGRFVEQTVGLARVSDLTIFWVLLGVFVALPGVMRVREPAADSAPGPAQTSGRQRPRGSSIRSARAHRSLDWQLFWRLAVVAWLVGGVVALTWVKTINYPRAGDAAGQAVEHFRSGDFQAALVRLDRAIELAPDVSVYYTHQATVYTSYLRNKRVAPERECSLELNGVPYETCLVRKAYLTNLAGVEQRPFYWRSRLALANTAGALGLKDEAIRLHQEVVVLVPHSWPLLNRLAEVYLDFGEPEAALEVLDASLAMTKDTSSSSEAVRLQELANQQLGNLSDSASLP